ncbi:MAG: carbamate kinase [Candidatus Thorarchaeota archaeon]
MNRRAVIAIGGNSLIKDNTKQSVSDQYTALTETCRHIADLIELGIDVVITSGNGPQVGFILRRSEMARKEVPEVPLDHCGAETQGGIGYMVEQAMYNELRARNIDKDVVSVVTQVRVSEDDPAFKNPDKPIGSFMDEKEAKKRAEQEGWIVREDAGRGWRRVVPSPKPVEIVELPAIRTLVEEGFVVYAVGGGGIPVVRGNDGKLRGIAAVIDKDRASSLLATGIGADTLIISTAIDRAYLNFGTDRQEPIDRMDHIQAQRYIEEGHFKAGSMLPKIEACVDFIRKGGKLAIITNPENLSAAFHGKAGTHIVQGWSAPPPPPRR